MIVIDGLDGTGKTTIVQMLSEELGYDTFKFPNYTAPETGEAVTKAITIKPTTLQQVNKSALNMICNRIESYKEVIYNDKLILDRYVLSNMLTMTPYISDITGKDIHTTLKENINKMFFEFAHYKIAKPDHYFILTGEGKVLGERISSSRDSFDPIENVRHFELMHDAIMTNRHLIEDTLKQHLRPRSSVHIIDTTSKTIDEVKNDILLKLKGQHFPRKEVILMVVEYILVTILTAVSIVLERFLAMKKKEIYDQGRSDKIEGILTYIDSCVVESVTETRHEYADEIELNGLSDDVIKAITDNALNKVTNNIPERMVDYVGKHLTNNVDSWIRTKVTKEVVGEQE